MRCPNCGYPILPNYTKCPKCGTVLTPSQTKSTRPSLGSRRPPLNEAVSKRPCLGQRPALNTKDVPAVPVNPEVEMIKNKIIWSIAPGQIARKVSEREMESLADAKGFIIQDGVIGIVYMDGGEVARLSGGMYTFTSDERIRTQAQAEIDREEQRRLEDRSWWRRGIDSIIHFFGGPKAGEDRASTRRRRDALEQRIKEKTKESVITVFLFSERVFPAVFGIQNGEFTPYVIQTKVFDVETAVSMQLKINDISHFKQAYLSDRNSYAISDVQALLNDSVRNILRREMQNLEFDGRLLPENVENHIKEVLKERLEGRIFGIQIHQVLDVTIDNKDFERFQRVHEPSD